MAKRGVAIASAKTRGSTRELRWLGDLSHRFKPLAHRLLDEWPLAASGSAAPVRRAVHPRTAGAAVRGQKRPLAPACCPWPGVVRLLLPAHTVALRGGSSLHARHRWPGRRGFLGGTQRLPDRCRWRMPTWLVGEGEGDLPGWQERVVPPDWWEKASPSG